MSLKILDTGAFRKDPYVIVDETCNVLAQSYSEDEKHYKHGLDEILSRIAALEAALAEAQEVIKYAYQGYEMTFTEYPPSGDAEYEFCRSCGNTEFEHKPNCKAIKFKTRAAEFLKKLEASA